MSPARQTERLTDAYLAAVLPLEEYQRRRLELEQREIGIAEQARQLEVSCGRHHALAGMVQLIEAFANEYSRDLLSSPLRRNGT